MRVFVVRPPEPVVTLEEAKQHLRVTSAAEDTLIQDKVATATSQLDGPDGDLGRALGEQTLEARFDTYEAYTRLKLPYPPVLTIVSVTYLDYNRQEVVADPDSYELLGRELTTIGSAPWEGCYVGRETLRVQYRAGYPTVDGKSTLPARIRSAILLMTGDLYRNRDTTAAVQMSKIPMSAPVELLLQGMEVYS